MVRIVGIDPGVVPFLRENNEGGLPESEQILAEVPVFRFENIVLPAIGQSYGKVRVEIITAIRPALLWEQECPKVFGQRPGYCAFINVRGSWIVSEGIFADYESGDSVVDQVAVLIPASCYLIDPNTCPGGVGDGGIHGPVVSWPPL